MSIKYLGIDWGEKNIGLAVADSDIGLATPYKTVSSINEVIAIVEQDEIDAVVVGTHPQMPVAKFSASDPFRRFVSELRNRIGISIEFSDETMSSLEADKLPGSRKTKAGRDEIAAMLILQGYLDRQKMK